MSAPPPRPRRAAGIALRVVAGLAVLAAGLWLSRLTHDALAAQMLPREGAPARQLIALALLAYVVCLALPFVPGAEIGLALLAVFGAAVAPFVYGATLLALALAYGAGRLVPAAALARTLGLLRLHRAADLIRRSAPLPPEARLALILDGSPPRLLALALRHRYLALALLVNLPGNAVIGGGGGILMLAGMSGLFSPAATLMAIALAVAPVPLAVLLMAG